MEPELCLLMALAGLARQPEKVEKTRGMVYALRLLLQRADALCGIEIINGSTPIPVGRQSQVRRIGDFPMVLLRSPVTITLQLFVSSSIGVHCDLRCFAELAYVACFIGYS